VAVHAAQIMGLRMAGVDMLEGADGPVLMEVNSSPGLEGIEAATGVDVAGEIVQLIEQEVLFPEIDIRQLEQHAPGAELSPSLTRHDLPNGKSVFCIAEGRIVNLAAHGGIGNPIEAMDLGLTLQARSLAALVDPSYDLSPGPQAVPHPVNTRVASAMLHSMGQLRRSAR